MQMFNILRSFYRTTKDIEASKPYKQCFVGFKSMPERDALVILQKLNTPNLCIDRIVEVK